MENEIQKKMYEKAYGYAVYLLGLKLRTEGEMREKLRLKKYNPEIIEEVLKELLANRYIDDQRYAEVYLENLKKYKHFGFFGIKKKLMEKRLTPDIIANILNEGLNEAEETKIARDFLRKQKAGIEKQKLASRLASRGFRSNVIFAVLGNPLLED
ncbi:MAG: RecX family transcriptional regulator [Patescibacteria group bacterium]|nr:RecX family transcriptional regulator [Patescibacteria group bacterium]